GGAAVRRRASAGGGGRLTEAGRGLPRVDRGGIDRGEAAALCGGQEHEGRLPGVERGAAVDRRGRPHHEGQRQGRLVGVAGGARGQNVHVLAAGPGRGGPRSAVPGGA